MFIQYVYLSTEVEVTIVLPPKDVNCMEKEEVTFTAELNKENIPVTWLKNGQEVKSEDGYETRSEGTKHYLTVLHTRLEDTAEYTIVAAEKTASAQLTVDGKIRRGEIRETKMIK